MTHSTRIPQFPTNLDDHAPWVAIHGLYAPYGQCQCGCGESTKLATNNRVQFGEAIGKPRRYLKGHHYNKHPRADHPNPSGLCLCGCGQITPISKVTRNKMGYVKGQHIRYVAGHGNAKRYVMPDPNPSGLCMCGCGQLAPIAKCTDIALGYAQGKHMRFIHNHHHNLGPTLEERFWEKVNKNGPIHPLLGTPCWLWTGSRNDAGYGKIGNEGESAYAHRVSYELRYGPLSDGLFVLHKCDNPPCVNPNHLFAGTALDNHLDMVQKGRQKGRNGKPRVRTP